MFRWYTVKFSSARPPASCASNPASSSVCRSGLMNGSPARLPGSVPKMPPMVPVVSGENLAPKSGWLPVWPKAPRSLISSSPLKGRMNRYDMAALG